MRRLILLLMISILAISLAPAQAQSRSVFWERWDVEISDFDFSDNSFLVREIYDIRFNGTFRFGSRIVSDDQLTGLTNILVFQDGQQLTASCSGNPGTYCAELAQEGISIRYEFQQPITDATERFVIQYRVSDALRTYEGGDQLWWVAVTEEKFGFSVGQSTITVDLPAGFAPREIIDPVVTYGAAADVRVEGTRVIATATDGVAANESFEIRVQFPHSGEIPEPVWQDTFDNDRNFEENIKPLLDLGLIVGGILIGLLGPLGAYILWYNRGRDPKVGPVPSYLTEPPTDLPPALVGTLIDEKANTRDIMSTLIDLGRRGYLVIQEDKTKSGLFGLGGDSEFTFKRTDQPLNDLRSYEKTIVENVFGGRLERSLDDLKDSFYVYLPGLKDDLYDDLVKEGLFTSKPSTTRAAYTGYGFLVLVAAGILGFFAFGQLETLTQTLLCVPAAMGFGGVSLMLVGNYMPRKTQKGAEEAAKWEAFLNYLSNLEKYEKVENATDQFNAYLPYAVAFGMDRSWIRRFSKVDSTPAPVWYFPTYQGGSYSGGYRAGTPIVDNLPTAGGLTGDVVRASGDGGGLDSMASGISGGLESMANGISDMLESASRTLTSTPSSSSSGSSGSWSGGGSSWSGGGSFGGGGSGGGSSGFG